MSRRSRVYRCPAAAASRAVPSHQGQSAALRVCWLVFSPILTRSESPPVHRLCRPSRMEVPRSAEERAAVRRGFMQQTKEAVLAGALAEWLQAGNRAPLSFKCRPPRRQAARRKPSACSWHPYISLRSASCRTRVGSVARLQVGWRCLHAHAAAAVVAPPPLLLLSLPRTTCCPHIGAWFVLTPLPCRQACLAGGECARHERWAREAGGSGARRALDAALAAS